MRKLPKRWSLVPPPGIGKAIARRVLTDAKAPNRTIVLSLGAPRQIDEDEWQCPILIEGLGRRPIADSAPGGDSLQALLLGVACIRWHLEQSGSIFRWLGETALWGMGGIPRQIPDDLGKEFDDRIGVAIAREIARARKFRAKNLQRLFVEGPPNPNEKKEYRKGRRRVSPTSNKEKKGRP